MKLAAALLSALLICGSADAGVIVRGTRGGAGSATLVWIEPGFNGDQSTLSNLDHYLVKYSATPGNHSIVVTVAAPATGTTLTGLAVGVTIYVVVSAVNASGVEGPETMEVAYTPS